MRPALSLISRYRDRIIHILIVASLTGFLISQAAVLSPPKVVAAESSARYSLDEPFTVTVWGLVDKNTLSVAITPDIPIKTTWQSGSMPLMQRLIIQPQGLLKPDSTYVVRVDIKNWYGATSTTQLNVGTGPLPKVLSVSPPPDKEDAPPDTEIVFETDKTFSADDYEFLAVPDFKYEVEVKDSKISVKPTKRLAQGQNYKTYLFLKLAGANMVLLRSDSFTIVPALQLAVSSPTSGAEGVVKQTTFSFTFNKEVAKQTWPKSFSITPQTEGAFSWQDEKTVVFTPNLPLKTNTAYSAKISSISLKGADGSRLDSDLIINFKTAGPVKVIGFSPSGSLVSPNSPMKVTFDQPVDQSSAQGKFSVSPALNGSFAWEGNILVFRPSALSLLTTYRIGVAAGVKSIGGEDGVEGFSATFTTTSERTRVFGYSVAGRAISATYFGVGPKKILLVATLHGSETNTGAMLSQWINYLRANQRSIGSDRTFIIVPYTNPDGRASRTRFNARGVDLNRNWGTSDWQALTYWLNNSYPSGGGPYPFSEPETAGLRDLITSEAPTAIITYHSAANLVIGDGIAQNLGDWYTSQTGYNRSASGPEDPGSCLSALGYCITGTLEEWATKRGTVTLVVEFASATSPEYERNLPALKGLLNRPI